MGTERFTSVRPSRFPQTEGKYRKIGRGSTRSVLGSSQSGFDWTHRALGFDERISKKRNRGSVKGKRRTANR
jgi:hypothetical protein